MKIMDLVGTFDSDIEILLEGKNHSTWIGEISDIPEEFYKYSLYRVYINDNSLIADCNGQLHW